MTNQQMRDSPAYKTYLAFATGAATPKKARNFKKPASPSKKKTLIAIKEPSKKPATRKQSDGVQIQDTPGVKAQLKKAIKQSRRETNIHQAGGLNSSKSKYKSWGDSDDDNDDDDQQNDEEFERINKDTYSDVNVELKDSESKSKGKDDEEMTDVGQGNAEHENVSQKVAGSQEVADQGLKRKKTGKETKPSKKARSTNISKGTTKSQQKSTSKFAQADETVFEAGYIQVPLNLREDTGNTDEPAVINVDPKDWFKKPKRPSFLDPDWNKDFSAFVMNRLQISDLTQGILVGPAYELLKEKIEVQRSDQKLYSHLEKIEVQRSDQKLYTLKEGDFPPLHLNDIMDMWTKSKPKQTKTKHGMEKREKSKSTKSKSTKFKAKDGVKTKEMLNGPTHQGLKRKKTGKETKPSKKARSTNISKGTTKSQQKSTSKFAQADETVFEAGYIQVPLNLREDTGNTDEPAVINVDPKDWFKKPKRPSFLDPDWNKGKSIEDKPTQKWHSDLAKA
nr:hypothetical protein [Tanacetum cinerariifolium]